MEGKSSEDINFSESIIKSLPFPLEIIRFIKLEELLKKERPDIVVRGHEFKNKKDIENLLIESLGIQLMFGSGSTHLSEQDLSIPQPNTFILRDSFKYYAEKNAFSFSSLLELIEKFSSKRVVVVGDLIVDEYITCQAIGMSQEDPIVVSTPVASAKYLGGAGIVAAHCRSMGAQVSLVSLIGLDEAGNWAENSLLDMGVNPSFIKDHSRPTVVKQRFKNGNHTIFRLTHFRAEEPQNQILSAIIGSVSTLMDSCDLLIFSDFSYGTLHSTVISELLQAAKKNESILIAADSQSSSQVGSLKKYHGVDLLTPTEYEARLEMRNEVDGIAKLNQELAKSLNIKSLILKLGVDGVLLGGFKNGQEVVLTDQIPAANQNAVDVSGAGDSLLASSSLTLASGGDLYESAFIGSIAAGIQVSRKGNQAVHKAELISVLEQIFH